MEHYLAENQVYDLFFAVSTDNRGFVGIGCIIKDADSQVISQNSKCIGADISHHFAEYKALMNGLEIAESIGLRRVTAHGNRASIYLEFYRVEGQVELWILEQLEALQKQIKHLDSFSVDCITRAENEDAIKVANYAAEQASEIESKIKRNFSLEEDTRNACPICLEKIFPSDTVHVDVCGHVFCFNCLSHHVETEISVGKVPVRCPLFIDCARYLHNNGCKRLISPRVFDTYSFRLAEKSISDLEKVYCPFPDCSALMCRPDDNIETSRYAASSSTSRSARRNIGCAECMECHRLFCVECKVPWHADLTCQHYQDLSPNDGDADDRKLFELAKEQKWRKCGHCGSLIILAEGCNHMRCRCGNEFCYTCGAEYRNQEKMCCCTLFDAPQAEILQAPVRPNHFWEIEHGRIAQAWINPVAIREAGIPEAMWLNPFWANERGIAQAPINPLVIPLAGIPEAYNPFWAYGQRRLAQTPTNPLVILQALIPEAILEAARFNPVWINEQRRIVQARNDPPAIPQPGIPEAARRHPFWINEQGRIVDPSAIPQAGITEAARLNPFWINGQGRIVQARINPPAIPQPGIPEAARLQPFWINEQGGIVQERINPPAIPQAGIPEARLHPFWINEQGRIADPSSIPQAGIPEAARLHPFWINEQGRIVPVRINPPVILQGGIPQARNFPDGMREH